MSASVVIQKKGSTSLDRLVNLAILAAGLVLGPLSATVDLVGMLGTY